RDLQRVGDDNEQRLLILQRYESEREALIKRQTDAEAALLEESTQRLFDLEASALDQRLAQIDREQKKREQSARETIRDERRLAETLANIQREYDTLREQARLEAHLREQAAVSEHHATLLRIQGAGWEAEKAAARAALDAALAAAPGDPEAARLAWEIYDAEIARIEQRIKEAYEEAGARMQEASMSAMERDLADIDRRAEEFKKAGREEAEVTEWVEARKAEIRERYRYEELAAEQRFQAELATLEGREFDAELARIEAARYSSLAQGVDPVQVNLIADTARTAAMVSEAERVLRESLSDIDLQVRLGELDKAGQIEAYERALDAANSMFEGIQVSARTTAQVEAQVAEMRRRLYDEAFQRAKENIERQAEREGWRLDRLAQRLEDEAKLYQLTEEQKRALEHETWRLRDRQRREDERLAKERRRAQERYEAELQQYLIESGQITVQEGLRRDLEAARERVRIAEQLAQELGGINEEANQQLAEAQLALARAEFALRRQELDDDRAFYETKVALGQWEAEERLTQLERLIQREREILGERAELSMKYRQLLMEERQLKQQIAAEDAEDRIRDIRAGEQTIRGLIIQRQELEALYAQYVAGGDESVEALERVRAALREVGEELDKVLGEQLLVRMTRRLENVLAGRMDIQDWFMAGIQDVVDDAARSITSQLTPAIAKFVELSVSGAHDFETAWTTAFSEVEITGTDIITILVMELVKLISGYLDAAKKLDEAVKRDREQTQADRERFEALMSAGFAGEFETSTRKHTEQVKYLFGLFRSNVTRTVEVTSEETQRLIENLERMLQELQRTGQTAMREAFDAPVGLAGTEFLSNLRRGIYDHVRDGLIQAFMEHQMYTQLMAPLWQAIDEGISAAFSGSSFDPDQFWQVVGPALDQWTSDIGDLEGPADWMQDVLVQLAELLDLPMQVGEQISRGGRRLTNLTGEQRDLFVEMWRPITLEATQAPTRHHDHMTRLDTIIDILVRSLGGGDELQTFLRTEEATMHATTITIEHIVTATLTGPIQGPVNMFVDGEDLERVVNRILKEHERAGMQGVRSTGG
ncbi:MAG TPA: hypothetical protein PLR82_08655, partial [Bacillota bacterium]|nr:hypothetical protein [Bacillota bacterium]